MSAKDIEALRAGAASLQDEADSEMRMLNAFGRDTASWRKHHACAAYIAADSARLTAIADDAERCARSDAALKETNNG